MNHHHLSHGARTECNRNATEPETFRSGGTTGVDGEGHGNPRATCGICDGLGLLTAFQTGSYPAIVQPETTETCEWCHGTGREPVECECCGSWVFEDVCLDCGATANPGGRVTRRLTGRLSGPDAVVLSLVFGVPWMLAIQALRGAL